MMWFLSETTKLEANWLFLDHEVVSDTMLIDYLNPTGSNLIAVGSATGAAGLLTVGVDPSTGAPFFKSAGFETPPMQEGTSLTPDMTSEEVADLTLQALAEGKSLLVTGWKNKLIALFGSKFPIIVVTRIGAAILRKMRLEAHKGDSK